jgi:hypothetical protein
MLKHAIIASLVATVSGFVRRADSSTFSLYAYGEGIGGLPIFAAGGKKFPHEPSHHESNPLTPCSDVAYIGDPSQSNLSNAAPIICKCPSAGTNTS